MDKNPVIKKLDPSQLEAACNALMMGFSSDPFQRWLMPDPTTVSYTHLTLPTT